MEQIGYSLVDAGGTEVAVWGDVIGQCRGIPDEVRLPNGDIVHGVSLGPIAEWMLVPRYADRGSFPTSFDGQKIIVYFQVLPQDVVKERERRLALGFTYDFGGERGAHVIGTTEEDKKGWGEVSELAQAAINTGQQNAQIAIVTNTGPVVITALEWQSVLIAAGNFRQPIWAKSFALQAMNPIPGDYTNDSYWA